MGTRKLWKSAKARVERLEDEPTCSKYVDTFLTTIITVYAVTETDEDVSVSIPDQEQVCHDVVELPQP